MIKNIITLLPELLLLGALGFLFFANYHRENKTAKTFFTISKSFLIMTLISALIFYNKSGYPDYMLNTQYTSMFKIVIYALAVMWFFVSLKWFLSKNKSSLGFYALGITSIFFLSLVISAQNFLLLGLALLGNCLCNYYMLLLREDEEENIAKIAKKYLTFSSFFMLSFLIGSVLLYKICGSLNYIVIADYYGVLKNIGGLDLLAFVLVISPILYMIGIAPFHFWFVDLVGAAILPVSGFLTIIPIFAYFSCLVNLIVNVFFPMYGMLSQAFIIFGVASIIIGAVCTNGEQNMRKLFAYSTVFHLGFMFVTMTTFNTNSVFSAFVYLLTYTLSMAGIYTCFFGFKSKGDYLVDLKDISGISTTKPYVSAASLVFMVSMIGCPPIVGFLGRLSVINNLVIEDRYWLILIIFIFLLLIVYAYLMVIKTIYFDVRKNNFDRVDKGIYIGLFINIVLVLISVLHPSDVLNYLEKMLVTVF